MQDSSESASGWVAQWHEQAEYERTRIHDGAALVSAARQLTSSLRAGSLVLTRNDESAALVGAALALVPDLAATVLWRPYHPGRHVSYAHAGPVVLVDAGPVGAGLLASLADHIPGVEILVGIASGTPVLRKVA